MSMKRDQLLALNKAASEGNIRTVFIETDWDGMPVGTNTYWPAVVTVTRSELNVAGLTDTDVPSLRIIEV